MMILFKEGWRVACSVWRVWRDGNNTKFWLENMEGNYVGIAEKAKRIILKCILKPRMWMCELTVTVSEQDPVKGCCKHVNALTLQEFLDLPSNYETFTSCCIGLVNETFDSVHSVV
jgi:hypothetical protein